MAVTMRLMVNYLCPYARRALYARAYKAIQAEVQEIDFEAKPEEFVAASPLGTVPALIITQNGAERALFESLAVVEYFASFPGPLLYPVPGQIYKSMIDSHVRWLIEPWTVSLFSILFKESRTPENCEKYRRGTQLLNDKFLSHRGFFMSGVIDYDQVTVADIALLGHVDVLDALKEIEPEVFAGEEYPYLWEWYEMMGAFGWVKEVKQPKHRIVRVIKYFMDKELFVLKAPANFYDKL